LLGVLHGIGVSAADADQNHAFASDMDWARGVEEPPRMVTVGVRTGVFPSRIAP
jgi:hypothetical protein